MTWELVITAIISIISSGSVVQFINWRAAKKKANLDNDSLAVDTLNNVIETLQKSNDHFETVNNQREAKITELRDKLTEAEIDLNVACSYICKKTNCEFRIPYRGLGTKWLQDLKEGKESPDYTPLTKETISNTK